MAIVGIETGGTTTRVAVAEPGGGVTLLRSVPTGDAEETLSRVVVALAGTGAVDAVGVAAFGPLDLDAGAVRATPKPGWSGFPLRSRIAEALGTGRVAVDTDVNAACLAECRWGVLAGAESAAYVTIGTGVGVGVVREGRPARGLPHPEAGHVTVRRAPGDDFPGVCPFHGGCWEGLVAAPAIRARAGRDGADLAPAEREAMVRCLAVPIADGLATLVYTVAPHRIALGGGVAGLEGLVPAVRAAFAARLAGYPGCAAHDDPGFITSPGLGARSGIAGALALAGMTGPPLWPRGD